MSAQNQSNECPVCLDALKGSGKALFTTACGHEFHFECIKQSINLSPSEQCPLCRANVPQLAAPPSSRPPGPPGPPRPSLAHQMQNYRNVAPRQQRRQVPNCQNMAPQLQRDPISVLEEEELETKTQSSPSASIAATDGGLQLSVDVEKDRHSCKKMGTITAIASLKAPHSQNVEIERPPCDIVAVVDRSGSMTGQKIALVKEALSYLLTQLKAGDRLSVVSFDHGVYHVFGLRKCTSSGRQTMHMQVNCHKDMEAKGGTDIKLGLTFGLRCLKECKTQNPVSAILLLTDGQGGAPSPAELKNWQQENAVPIHCFGFGRDHDARTLTNIAELSNGTFSFIDKLDMVGDAFATCLGGLLSVTAQEVVLRLDCKNDYSMIQHVNTTYPLKMSADSKSAEITIPDMLAEEKKDVVFTLSVRECPENEAPTPLFSASGSYLDLRGGKDKGIGMVLSKEVCNLARPVDDANAVISYSVDKEKNRINVAEVLKEAVRLGEQNKLDAARECLDAALKEVKNSPSGNDPALACLIEDLNDTRNRFESQARYRQEGYAFAKQQEASHRMQRGMGQKAAYCNSVQMVQKCSNSSYRSGGSSGSNY